MFSEKKPALAAKVQKELEENLEIESKVLTCTCKLFDHNPFNTIILLLSSWFQTASDSSGKGRRPSFSYLSLLSKDGEMPHRTQPIGNLQTSKQ